MSTGISISSINRIKELAEEKKYAEALEILDTQDLDKSINPQFLKISGEIFRENKRYYDSRRILLKAHEMAPQGTRIIAELIQLHLSLGHFDLAKKYYDEYKFYASEEDTQREFVEYIMKKATGNDIKELASIIIPILERIPEDRWNFEAVLLYDKLDRKDKALEEAQYILENFKDSVYIKQVIEYIDDKLDVDECFYVYPKEAKDDDAEVFGDLIEREAKLLEKDYLMMYPPEPRIMVMEDDNDAPEVKHSKEKSNKEKSNKEKKKLFKKSDVASEDSDSEDGKKQEKAEKEELDKEKSDKKNTDKDNADKESSDKKNTDIEKSNNDKTESNKPDNNKESVSDGKSNGLTGDGNTGDSADSDNVELRVVNIEEELKQEREAALERLLAKRIDKDAIRESAKQMARAVNLDTDKAKEQVKNVTDSVKDNVKKVTETFGEVVVGTGKIQSSYDDYSEEFVDGIIESVITAPKKSVGQVVTNEELDNLVPDSLEALSADEMAEITAKKEEQERLELEALEASLKQEEEKKNKKKKSKNDNDIQDSQSEDIITIVSDVEMDASNIEASQETIASVSFAELKAQFLADSEIEQEEKPLDSLGFISVVQSDVSAKIEEETPEAAEILHRMIDNKEYYSGDDSRGFESKASYENHGFEVEDFSFNEYFDSLDDNYEITKNDSSVEYKVDDIFIKENVLDFNDVIPEEVPTEEVPTEEIPAEEVPAEDTLRDETLIQEAQVEDTLPKEPSIEKTPVEDTLTVETSIDEVQVEDISIEEITIENNTVEEIIFDEISEETPIEEDLAKETPIEETSMEETLNEGTSEEAPAEEISIEDTSGKAPAEEISIEETSEEAPAEEISIEDTSGKASAEEISIEETSEEAPAGEISIEETSAEAPIEETSVKSDSLDYDGFISPEEDVIIVDESLLDEIEDEIEYEEELNDANNIQISNRELLRIRIILTDQMVKGLLDLKESR